MKKHIFFFLLLLFTLAGCGTQTPFETENSKSTIISTPTFGNSLTPENTMIVKNENHTTSMEVHSPERCFSEEFSNDDQWIAMSCSIPLGKPGISKRKTYETVMVTNTSNVDWSPLFSEDDGLFEHFGIAFSPNNKYLAVSNWEGGIWIFETGTWDRFAHFSVPVLLHKNDMVWFPDSQSLAFFSDESEHFLMRIDLSGNAEVLLHATDVFQGQTKWDPIGNTIDFIGPAIAPDGRNIAYLSSVFDKSGEYISRELWIMDIEKGNKTRIYEFSTFVTNPSWSKDGKYLVLRDYNSLLLYTFETSTLTRVYDWKYSVNDFKVIWSSFSDDFIFIDFNEDNGNYEMVKFNLASKKTKELFSGNMIPEIWGSSNRCIIVRQDNYSDGNFAYFKTFCY